MTETKERNARSIYEGFRIPFPAKRIKWRPGKTTGDSGLALGYIDARDVMYRLDEVVGINNWQTKIRETSSGRIVCELSVRIEGEWITKSDGAGDTDLEGEKGGISDAIKRAGVHFGIGRYLYELPTVWCKMKDKKFIETPQLPTWATPKGWKIEVLKIDGDPLSEREKLDAIALLVDYKQEKGPEAVAGMLLQLGYNEAIEGWTTGMVKKFVEAVGALPEKATAS